jgi:hypothetical protein
MEALQLRTYYLHPSLSDEQIDTHNASNSVIISHSLFQDITDKDAKGNVAILGLYYKSKKIYVHIIDSHNENPNIMYVPQWIYNHFNYQEDDLVNYMQVFPKLGNRIKIKPRGDFYAYLDDPITALRNGFEKYSCLIENSIILINVDSIALEIEILETYINSEKNTKNQPIYIRGVELEVDIEEEIIKPEIIKPDVSNIFDDFSSMLPQPMPIIQDTKFPGKGYSLK